MKTIKSNWLGGSSASPTKFRAASNGKVFTRREKLNLIQNEQTRIQREANRLEMILVEKRKIAEARKQREERSKAFQAQLDNPTAKLKRSKGGFFIQGRNEKGGFLPKIQLTA